ncbi:MAG: nickel-responsive transcriptional regulator NikR [Candidatus Latescibacteria bacterium]|nr:nickel-responsive transcriptional regulator NikR [Candidatus Latescibacterota bacterium]
MTEHDIQRFGVSIGAGLLDKFDVLITGKGYTNRSEAIRDLIRNKLVEAEWESSTDRQASIGTITIVYDHHTREIGDRLTDLAHDHHDLVISSMHVHLTHKSCLEVMLVKGCGKEIRAFSDRVLSIRGVKHGKLVITGLVEEEP